MLLTLVFMRNFNSSWNGSTIYIIGLLFAIYFMDKNQPFFIT